MTESTTLKLLGLPVVSESHDPPWILNFSLSYPTGNNGTERCKKRRQGNTDDMSITVIRSAKPSRIQIRPLTEELLTVDIEEASTSCSREAVHSLLYS